MPTIGPDMAFHKAQAVKQINAVIAEVRLRYITDLPGQEALYQRKEAHAQAYKDAGYPADLTGFPLIAAETGITAPTSQALADLWLTNAADWEAIAATLEAIRMTAVMAVKGATTRADIATTMANMETELSAIP